jgi:hypothetical protein
MRAMAMQKMNMKIITIVLIVLMISFLFYLLIVNLNIFTDTTMFNQFDLDTQTELFTMKIPNGNENFRVAGVKCPKCIKQGVEV